MDMQFILIQSIAVGFVILLINLVKIGRSDDNEENSEYCSKCGRKRGK